ncbi:MAG: hypothetical protein CTY31_09410 [Hyphomicrobium sp.]|nr:MAG: hypothetical protein CTY31_09410 [Hyphomicrobium sp.]
MRILVVLLCSLLLATTPVLAQPAPQTTADNKKIEPAKQTAPPKQQAAPATTQPQPPAPSAPASTAAASQSVMPPAEDLLVMIRSSLLALHHANLTGNYTVLRDLGAPGFQSVNSAARLSDIFRAFRSEGIDLTKCVLVTPQLAQPPGIDSKGRLRLKGLIEISPTAVYFDLLYARVGDTWRLFGISVAPRVQNAGAPASPAVPPPNKPTAGTNTSSPAGKATPTPAPK